ncbi:hypothetical protein TKK_0011481 [Trichogramma kaykai]
MFLDAFTNLTTLAAYHYTQPPLEVETLNQIRLPEVQQEIMQSNCPLTRGQQQRPKSERPPPSPTIRKQRPVRNRNLPKKYHTSIDDDQTNHNPRTGSVTTKSSNSSSKYESRPELSERNKLPHTCTYCGTTFSTRQQLRSHVAEAHKCVASFVCESCGAQFKCRQSLREHFVRKHTEGFRYRCASCSKEFKMKSDLYMHVQNQHNAEAGSAAQCDQCGRRYRNQFALKKHRAHAHNERPYGCSICKRRLATEESLEQHTLLHTRKERTVCQICGKTYSGNDPLKKHMRIHTDDRPYSCKLCGKAFRRQNTHKQHLLTHTGQKPYVCDICGKAFTQKPGLITHRKKHPGPLPPLPAVSIDYVIADLIDKADSADDCIADLPNGTFSALNDMDVLRIKQDLIDSLVNDDLDRICKYCGESFLYVNRLVTHLQLVHGVERPFQCPRCDKSYPQRFMLNHHVRKNHGPLVVCAHCGFTAIELAQLERHIRRMHENEAPISAATPVVKDYYNVSLHGFFIQ